MRKALQASKRTSANYKNHFLQEIPQASNKELRVIPIRISAINIGSSASFIGNTVQGTLRDSYEEF